MNSESNTNDVRLISALTMVIWTGFFALGIAGICLNYPNPIAAAAVLAPVQTRILDIDATPRHAESSNASASPAKSESLTAVPLPPQVPAFAPPVEPPSLAPLAIINPFVAPKTAPMAHVAAAAPASQPAPVVADVHEMTLGSGEGVRIQPEYPIEAQLAGQRGTVVVRFIVAGDGTVNDAKAVTPCRWPLLNQAALRAVRDAYFPAGPRGVCQVTITFQ